MLKTARKLPASPEPFNPLEKKHLGESIADALLEQPLSPLPPTERFVGAGVYAIYYSGKHSLYSPIAKSNRATEGSIPIYVGKATPAGGRKGGFLASQPTSADLYSRLCKHAASIRESENLGIEDFSCRYLVVDDIWIPLGEALLISRFMPLWNHLVEGFGINDPGKGRQAQQLSTWDTLHPGRSYASNLTGKKRDQEAIEASVRKYFDQIRIKG